MSTQKSHSNHVFIVVIVVFVLLIISLIKNAIGLYQARHRRESAQESVSALISQKDALENQLKLQTDPASIDQIIRNKLNRVFPGETVVVITGSNSSLSTPSASPQPAHQATPPYLQWWSLFTQ